MPPECLLTAVAWFIAFAALLLHDHPQWRDRAQIDSEVRRAVAQQIRRIVPFVPVLAARASYDQDVLGIPLRKRGLVVLDVYGPNHDSRIDPTLMMIMTAVQVLSGVDSRTDRTGPVLLAAAGADQASRRGDHHDGRSPRRHRDHPFTPPLIGMIVTA